MAPERIEKWLAGFADRHGPTQHSISAERVVMSAVDGAVADCAVPFAPMVVDDSVAYGGLIEHAMRHRKVGVILVRRGGHAAGVFQGRDLVVSKVGSRHVQGRTAAGGQSQQRFARRRQKQAREAFEAAANVVARIVLPHASSLDAVVVGGDKLAIDQVLSDSRLSKLAAIVVPPHLAVPDPKLAVLKKAPDMFRAVRITLTEP